MRVISRKAISLISALVLALSVGPIASGRAAGATTGKGMPPSPTIGQYSKELSRPLTGDDLKRTQAKEARARVFMAQRAKSVRANAAAAAAASKDDLAEPYYQQINEAYCGPATFIMVADFWHIGWSGSSTSTQQAAASLLGTTSDGTAWYGSDNVPSYPGTNWYPMADAMNYRLYKAGHASYEYYVVQPLPGSPTSAQRSQFVSNLITDISSDYPEIDNQYTVPGSQLPYQPSGTWYHWWSARGYSGSGATTLINDPAGWSQGREQSAPSTSGAHNVVTALGGRGYIF